MNKAVCYLLYSMICVSIYNAFGYLSVPGDKVENNSFSFNIGGIIVNNFSEAIFISAKESNLNSASERFKISFLPAKYNFFIPMLTEKSNLGDNPFQDKKITHLESMTINNKYDSFLGVPLIIIEEESDTVYCILNSPFSNQYGTEKTNFIKTISLTDNENKPGDVLCLSGNINGFTAIVSSKGKKFGDVNSNTVLYSFKIKPIIEVRSIGNERAHQTKQTLLHYEFEEESKKTFSEDLSVFKLSTEDLSVIDNHAVIYSDSFLQKTYFGTALTKKNSSSPSFSPRAVTMELDQIAPKEAFNGDNIVGSLDKSIKINFLSSLFTSAGLSYLIVGSFVNLDEIKLKEPNNNSNRIYAIPLVNDPESSYIGKLAKKNSIPSKKFTPNKPFFFLGNFISDPALNFGDLYKESDLEVLVGGEILDPLKYKVKKVIGYKDTVFIAVDFIGNGIGFGGIFYSQAILKEDGTISSWTKWRRHTLIGNIVNFIYKPSSGTFFGVNEIHPKSILLPSWSINSDLTTFDSNTLASLPIIEGGIQGAYDIPFNHKIIGNDKSSYLIQVGYRTVIIQQTSKNEYLEPGVSGSSFISKDGTLNQLVISCGTIAFTGGELNKSGALITATAGVNSLEDDGWIIVGGSNGIFILSKNDGSGFGSQKIKKDFSTFSSDMSWRKLGNNLGIVKKIISDSGYLYVMTLKNIYKLELKKENIVLAENAFFDTIHSIKLISNIEHASFSDMLVSSHSILVATSQGLFKNLNGTSAKQNSIVLEKIELPDSMNSFVYLYPITRSQVSEDWAKSNDEKIEASNIYVVDSSIGTHRGRLYRLSCLDNSQSSPLLTNTIFPIDNVILKDKKTYYFDTKSEQFSIAGDGASWFTHSTLSNGLAFKGLINLLPPSMGGGILQKSLQFLPLLSSPLSGVVGPVNFISGLGFVSAISSIGIYSLR